MTRPAVGAKRELGQHFLVDENILGVIGRLAALQPADIVLEVGAGLGVLTRYLAARVNRIHAIELDTELEPRLREVLQGAVNVDLVFGDAMQLPLGDLEPQPTKLVANLPYSIATPLCVESLDGLPTIEHWCVMLQREVADRFVAEPGSRSYGAVSVLIQLTCDRTGFHPVARTCFRPQPNVDSALVALARRRSWGAEYPWLKRVIQAAFAHRRKTLANSLELAGVASREQTAGALGTLGRPAEARAESLAPEELVELTRLLA
jgi:16S rRNA (adenine1518-N6/adenine1519-N6)-dimethyltransferase